MNGLFNSDEFIFSMKRIDKKFIKDVVRYLRKNQTESEKIFWELVRNRRLFGKKFLRQHPIVYEDYDKEKFFVADFYCAEKNLVVEIDGKIHENLKEYDELRTYIINNLEKKVIRIKNEELKNLNKVIQKLKIYLE
jgi:very-short-patch-repair endonuclease